MKILGVCIAGMDEIMEIEVTSPLRVEDDVLIIKNTDEDVLDAIFIALLDQDYIVFKKGLIEIKYSCSDITYKEVGDEVHFIKLEVED